MQTRCGQTSAFFFGLSRLPGSDIDGRRIRPRSECMIEASLLSRFDTTEALANPPLSDAVSRP